MMRCGCEIECEEDEEEEEEEEKDVALSITDPTWELQLSFVSSHGSWLLAISYVIFSRNG